MEKNLVSIITPMYNAEKWIEKTILSVQGQSYQNWEMIIIDDCSSDNSAIIVKNMAKLDNRIKYHKNVENSGVAVTRNRGIGYSIGQYIAFLDSDDLWYPEKLEKQIEKMQREKVAFCYTACCVIDENDKKTGKVRYVPASIDYKELLKGNEIPCLTVVLDREQISDIEMPQIHHEDYVTWLNILRSGITAHGMNEVLAAYRVNTHSLSGNKFKAMGWTWNIYRNYLKLNIFQSCRYFVWYVIKAFKKRS